MEKVVLAYSGGLDTSVILKWLAEKGLEVIAYSANIGQHEDWDAVKAKALATGASKVYIEDLQREFVTDYIFPAIQASAIYEDRYLLGTSVARPVIAKKMVEIAQKEGAAYFAHGSTGKGNDQVRFELGCFALDPSLKVIAPWKNPEFIAAFKGRTDLINYAKEKGIPVTATHEKPYSSDANLMHISYEAGVLENTAKGPTKDMFSLTVDPKDAPETPTVLTVEFAAGIPVKVTNLGTGKTVTDPVEIVTYLNEVGGANGVGRIDIVENRYVGIKSRGVYETPGVTILWKAHQDLEALTLDKEVFRIKQSLVPKIADCIYNGFWFSPEMDLLMKIVRETQTWVNGKVWIELYKGNITIQGRESPDSLYNEHLSSMDEEGGFNQQDSAGFININAVRLKNYTLTRKGSAGMR